ncbi:hypothetical protein G4B88_007545 [Cannabis sativa]|uniref:Zinc knuckle CX2CX4HX4C domain-containing protein n=1 Tax=Cannabis sativa TaxID=3483 RepID=A0A7J6HSL2_CANSA|nr:hypothetical protein G4B88_007545 [Cannabis sativa]
MSTLRFRATIDLNKPIFSGFFLRRQKLKDLWIKYKYERLPKLCFKCGLLTHDQSVCFKTPTVVKDGSGNYYPKFGVWLKSDDTERSTFTTPLAKWFQDWVLQKRIFLDPTLRNPLKVQKAIRHGESDELRECRRQLPGKKQIVSDEEHNQEASQAELVITQLPLVSLPGIGEVAPFGKNTKSVSIQDLQELKKVVVRDAEESSNGNPSAARITDKDGASRNTVTDDQMQTAPCEQKELANSKQTASPIVTEQSEAHIDSPVTKAKTQDIPYSTSILGSQALLMDWPSTECWAQPKARELLMGGLTLDKYFREPTLFNALMDINDFRVQEHLVGPHKRKASDGIILKPSPEKHVYDHGHNEANLNTPITDTQHHSPTKTSQQQQSESKNQSDVFGEFNSGSAEAPSSSKRRGRPRKSPTPTTKTSCTPRKRGRPPKAKHGLSATPKSFKWKKKHLYQWLEGLRLFNSKKMIDASSKFIIYAIIDFEQKGLKWLLLGIYGPPHREDKEDFWISIGDMVNQSSRHVLLIGDMNGTLKDAECFHYSKRGNSSRYAFDFRRMVNGVGLIDLCFQGPCYTWAKDRNNNNYGGSTKRARLDRGLASSDWRILFPNAIVKHLSSTGSDHRPIILDSTGGVNCESYRPNA